MTLRAGMSGLALRSLRARPRLPRCIFRHLLRSMILRCAFLAAFGRQLQFRDYDSAVADVLAQAKKAGKIPALNFC
jgi:hypothetical protein